MPTFQVTDPNSGRTIRLTGDSPPTEQELESIFSGLVPTEAVTEGKFDEEQQGVSRDELIRMQKTLVTPAEDTALGSFIEGARRGVETVGQGILQRGAEIGEFFGADTKGFQENLKLSGDISAQRLKETSKQRPLTTGAGEIAGTIAAFPAAPASIPAAIAAGAAFGAIQPTDKPSDIGLNILQDAAIGGLGAFAAPFLQKGFNKSQAMFSAIIKKATGADPRPEMFLPSGGLSDNGKSAIDKLGISEDDFSRIFSQLDEKLDPIASTRISRAEEQGIPLTTAQATQDFAQQEAEQTLRSSISREGEAARQVGDIQQKAIGEAQEAFEGGFKATGDREARGGLVQEALTDIEKEGRKNVSELYKIARETEGAAIDLDNASLLDVIDDNIIDRPVSESTLNTIESALAKFGLIDGEVVDAGRFKKIVDSEGKSVKFKGEQTPLTLDNAEEFRQKLRQAASGDESGAVTQMINKLDSIVDDAVKQLPEGAERTGAFQAARSAFREQKEIFSAKDIVQKLVTFKKGTKTEMIAPDRVIDSILKGVNSLSDLQRVKRVLMNSPNNKSLDAWKSIQAQGAADLFSKSIGPAGISGARLETAIKGFGGGNVKEGEKRLKVLFGDKYNQFNNLRKAIGDATIPVQGTTNPSGTAYKLLNFMTRIGSVGTFGADAVIPLLNKVKDAAKSRKVLQRIKTATPKKVQEAVRANNELLDSFVRLGSVGTLRDQLNE